MTYRFVRRLAEGGFSEVFAVEDAASALPERLVLKRLSSEMSGSREVREAFAAEAKILRELRHANVVPFRRCYFDEQGRVCLLMEEVAGEPLDAWARRVAATPETVLDVFEDVLQAVDYLHHRPLPYLHLDLKPDNVLVTTPPGGRPKPVLIDFGIARRSGGPGLRAYTPPYAAPEQSGAGRLTEATDVHALGQMLAELVELLELPAPTTAGLRQVAERARGPRRSARFADAGQMGLAFRQARRAAAQPPAADRAWLPAFSVRQWRAAAAGAAALVIALAVLALRQGPPEPPASGSLAASAAATTAVAGATLAQVEQLLAEASVAALDQRFDHAERSFSAARRLSRNLPPNEDATPVLEEVGRRIDLIRKGGSAGERSRAELREFLTRRLERP